MTMVYDTARRDVIIMGVVGEAVATAANIGVFSSSWL